MDIPRSEHRPRGGDHLEGELDQAVPEGWVWGDDNMTVNDVDLRYVKNSIYGTIFNLSTLIRLIKYILQLESK